MEGQAVILSTPGCDLSHNPREPVLLPPAGIHVTGQLYILPPNGLGFQPS